MGTALGKTSLARALLDLCVVDLETGLQNELLRNTRRMCQCYKC